MELEKTRTNQFKTLTNQVLLESAKNLVQKERALSIQVLECLREIEARKLHLARGYSSLHEFAVKELNYSDGAAFRRIQAMRLTRDLPEVKKSIQEGKLSLSTASQAQRFFYSQKITKTKDKKDLIQKIENKSTREAESFFAGLAPETIRPEKERMITETHTEVRIVIDQKLKTKLERIKNLISHKHPNPSYAEILNYLSDIALENLDPEVKHQKKKTETKTTAAQQSGVVQNKILFTDQNKNSNKSPNKFHAKSQIRSRYIPELLRRKIGYVIKANANSLIRLPQENVDLKNSCKSNTGAPLLQEESIVKTT